MKVLVFSHHTPRGVYGEYDYNLCRHLQKLGAKVTDIALMGDNFEYCDNSELVSASSFIQKYFSQFFSVHLLKKILSCNYDVIHVGAAFWSFLPLQISLLNRLRREHKPVVMVTHAFHPEYQKSFAESIKGFLTTLDKNYLLFGFRCLAYTTVDHVICMSETEKAYIGREFKIPDHKLSVVTNGVDPSRFKESYYNFREKYKIHSNHIVLFVGQLIEMKGIPFLLEALISLIEEKYDICLVMSTYTTNSESIERLKRQLKEQNLVNRVRLLIRAPEQDLVTAYKSCDLLVLPSVFNECSPTVILEAMASEKPVVASRIDGIPAIVKDGETGFIVTPASSKELSEKISRLLQSEELRRSMGLKAKLRVASKYTWDIIAEKILHVYTLAINNSMIQPKRQQFN
jgi:glycosyltransferase involved in cell wall biosynthesis